MNTGSVEGSTGWYSVVLGQNRAVLVASMMSFQKIYGLHGLNHQIIEYSKKEKVITDRQTDKQTDRISSCRLNPFCRRGRGKIGIGSGIKAFFCSNFSFDKHIISPIFAKQDLFRNRGKNLTHHL